MQTPHSRGTASGMRFCRCSQGSILPFWRPSRPTCQDSPGSKKQPTGNLDNETADGILRLLTDINRKEGTAIVMVTHNRSIFEKYPGRVFVCKDEKCQENRSEEIIDLALTI